MCKFIRCVALASLLVLPCSLWAEIEVPPACRIKNRPPGRCGWCALETLARYHQIEALYGLTRAHRSRCTPEELEKSLKAKKVAYRIQYPGKRSKKILHYAIDECLGAAIGFREIAPGTGGHIVTLVGFSQEYAKVIDSNDKQLRVRKMPMKQFLRWWDGFALVLEATSDDE
jgi:ABC-type bacteriocin/lantibiotic exporter with double-glycine peptidase domain